MKKLLSLILCVLLILPMALTALAQEEVISITTRQQLEQLAANPQCHYRLDADIDLGGKDWVPIPFSGSLDGNHHTIYNLTVRQPGAEIGQSIDGNNISYDTVFAGLFSVVKDARIRDLSILGADISIETDQHCCIGILAGRMENTSLEDCTVDGRAALYTTAVMGGVGGLVGFGLGDILGCTVNCELVYADRSAHDPGKRAEQFMGGLLSAGLCNLIDNQVTIQGYDSCWGYVHNGGLVGLHYRFGNMPFCKITGNSVTGRITFFENNKDRRAYCGPYCGEMLPTPFSPFGNTQTFERNELYDVNEELKPHSCQNPAMTETKLPHDDEVWGYTLHKCDTCGYEFRTDYQAPGHILGDWVITKEPSYDQEGTRSRLCSVCGQSMMEESLPVLKAASQCILSEQSLSLDYEEKTYVHATVLPEDAADRKVVWSSSDESVVTVDNQGHILATGRGQAVLTCTSQDGFAVATCPVEVGFSPMQWLVEIFLFGWIWY